MAEARCHQNVFTYFRFIWFSSPTPPVVISRGTNLPPLSTTGVPSVSIRVVLLRDERLAELWRGVTQRDCIAPRVRVPTTITTGTDRPASGRARARSNSSLCFFGVLWFRGSRNGNRMIRLRNASALSGQVSKRRPAGRAGLVLGCA